LKKSSDTWNILYLFASGGLILYVLSLLGKKKKQESETVFIQVNNPNTDQLRNWIIREEVGKESNFLAKAVKDGKSKDGKQLFSIGFGHQIQPSESALLTETISLNEAKAILTADLNRISKGVKSGIKVPINKNQEIALISLAYNIGTPAFLTSTLLKKLNEGDYKAASEQFQWWRLSEGKVLPGLVARRERERVLFTTPI
jgi:lysozyme